MKIIYGDNADQLTADELKKFIELDNYDSGDETYAVDGYDGVLDSDQGEINSDQIAELVVILAGESSQSEDSEISGGNSITTSNGKTYTDGIVSIPGGQFEMGSINGESDERKSNGATVTVSMTGFKLSKSEVTVGQYKAYLVATGDPRYSKLPDFEENKKGDDFPVVGVSYEDARKFATFYGGDLPTAAQIEYASKGPSHNDAYGTPIDKAITYSNGARTTAVVCGNSNERTNGFGICDLAGNVWERTLDVYAERSYDSMPKSDPSNPYYNVESGWNEIRGGSWYNLVARYRSANRGRDLPSGLNDVGFRVAWPQDS